jgi:isopenicillin N synthase-like dioxygenase
MTSVPIIDVAPLRHGDAAAQRAVARAVDDACRSIGFLVITGHGVPAALIERIDAVSRQFFDLSLTAKMTVRRPAPDVTRGAIPISPAPRRANISPPICGRPSRRRSSRSTLTISVRWRRSHPT